VLYRFSILLEAVLLLIASQTIIKHAKENDKFLVRISYLKNFLVDNKLTIPLMIIIVVYWFFQNETRIIIDEGYIQSRLGGKYETQHFEIYYPSDYYNDESIKKIAGFHEFYYEQISNQLKTNLSEKIKSYIYPSSDVKSDLIGARNTNITKPWLKQIHVNAGSIDEVLKHELVHVFMSEFGLPIIGVGIQSGVIEGVAMAIEWDFSNRTLHQFSAQLLKMNMDIDMEKLLTIKGFSSQYSSYSYVLCGSFCKFLIDKYSVENFEKVYAWSNFEDVYQKKLSELNSEWKDFLRTIKTEESDSSLVVYLFKRPPIFQKVCARIIANINQMGWRELNSRNFNKAKKYFLESLDLSNSNDAQQGLILSYFQSGNYDSVISLTDKVFYKASQKDMFLPLRLHRGDAFWQKAVRENKKKFIDSALVNYSEIRRVNLDDSYNFAIQCRINVFNDSNIYKKMVDYYVSRKDEFTKALLVKDLLEKYHDFHIGKMILARTLFSKGEYNLSLEYLNSIPDANINEYFRYEKYRLLGMNYFYINKYLEAKTNFQHSMNFQFNEATQNRLNEWIEKCEFFIYLNQ
jgi:tetratricopeptide (TPR) repeat protein